MNDEFAVATEPTAVSQASTEPEFERSLPFPLTDIQEAYWVGRNIALELGNVAPQRWIEIEGNDLDINRFTLALRRLIDRHDMLRAIIRQDGQQQILSHVTPYEIDVLDLRGYASEVVTQRLREVRRSVSLEQFVTFQWPLFSVRASQLGDHHYRLHFNFDMLLVDLMSFQIMFRDLAILYDERDETLAPIDFGFRDYVLATRSMRGSVGYRKAKHHWWSRLPSLPAMPELPLEGQLDSVAAPRFEVRVVGVEPEAWNRIKDAGADRGLTPSTIALTAFCEAVGGWSAKNKFGLMMTAFNRRPLHPAVNEMLGDFTSTILLDVERNPGESFEVRARRLQQQVWVGFRHGQVSGIEVLREMNRRNGTPLRAAAPVIFNSTLQTSPGNLPPPSALEGPLPMDDAILAHPHSGDRWQHDRRIGALGDVVYSAGQAPQILLEARASDRAGYLAIVIDFLGELLPSGAVDDMARVLTELLRELSQTDAGWSAPRRRLLPPAQLHQREAINAAARTTPALVALPALVAQHCRQSHDRQALAWSTGLMTFGELDARAEGVARRLSTMVARNDLVAVVMERGWEQVVGVLGAVRAGAGYVPIDPELPPERLHHLLRHSMARVGLGQRRVIEAVEGDQEMAWLAVDELPEQRPSGNLHGPRVDDLAYVIYTSGSTGLPKGVMIQHRAATNTIVEVNRRFRVGVNDRVLSVSSLSFDLSVYDIFGLLAAGGGVVLLDSSRAQDPAHWLELMWREEATIWNSVPSLMELLVEHIERHRASPPPLRLIMLSGDRIPVDLVDRLRSLFPGSQLVSLGGATEASIWSTYYPIGSVGGWKRIPYGRPLANQSLHVLDDALDPCPVWVSGQLYIGGAGLAQGYWRDAEKTAASFLRHPVTGERLYRTGDICRYLPDGNLDILGREDSQVKIRGSRIELGEIEAALLQHPDVREAVIAVSGERSIDKRLVAYVVLREHSTLDPAELHGFLRLKLPRYMLPSSYIDVPTIPRNANGKIALAALPDPSTPDMVGSGGEIPEEDQEAAQAIAAVVESVLDIDGLGSEDVNLLDLGATSIDYLRMMNRLEEELGFRPDLEKLLDRPTLSHLTSSYRTWLLRSATVDRPEAP